MKNFGKYLLLVLAFLSIGGGSSYGTTLPEVRKNQPVSSEDLQAAGSVLWAYRGNPFQEVYDLSEKLFFGSISVIPHTFSTPENGDTGKFGLNFRRDLRRIVSQQIFPKHFFL